VTATTTIQQEPGVGGAARAQVGARFPLTLTGGARWVGGALWYQATWGTPHLSGSGWLPATTASFTAPTGGDPASAGFDALDPALAAYLARSGGAVGAVAYDVTRGITYAYNADSQFIAASSIKVPILLALLAQTEAEGRELDGGELAALTRMIEDSDNDATQQLYEEIGDAAGLSAFMARIGAGSLAPAPGDWGWSTITPRAMAQLLTLLQAGRILTPADRVLALGMMRQVEPDQRAGLGDTAPTGAVVALKDGWVTGPDGLWDVNTSGIVAVGGETYILTVYTTGDEGGEAEGAAILDHICAAVARDLT
jgi:beta-lactamase class A